MPSTSPESATPVSTAIHATTVGRGSGQDPGPSFWTVNKGGGMSLRAIGKRVAMLGGRDGLGTVNPRVLRRSFGTALLAAANDLATVADCMGHASTDTTRNHYDRRGKAAKAAAMSTIPVPYVRPPGHR